MALLSNGLFGAIAGKQSLTIEAAPACHSGWSRHCRTARCQALARGDIDV